MTGFSSLMILYLFSLFTSVYSPRYCLDAVDTVYFDIFLCSARQTARDALQSNRQPKEEHRCLVRERQIVFHCHLHHWIRFDALAKIFQFYLLFNQNKNGISNQISSILSKAKLKEKGTIDVVRPSYNFNLLCSRQLSFLVRSHSGIPIVALQFIPKKFCHRSSAYGVIGHHHYNYHSRPMEDSTKKED